MRPSPASRNGEPDDLKTEIDRIPIQLFSEQSFLQKLSNVGPTATAVVSLILTFFVWHYSRQLAERQIELQAKQIEIQSRQLDIQKQQTQREAEQAEAELADLRFKFLSDLTATDENKRHRQRSDWQHTG